MGPIDLTFLEGDDIRAALAARDIGTLYRYLRRLGLSQRQIGQWTDQAQSEVSEIIQGRQVRDVWVLERIADGLGIPRARLGVSYGEEPAEAPSAQEEVDQDVKRRALIATASAAALGEVLFGLGEPIELALPNQPSLPSQLSVSHVHAVRAVTEQLRGVARYYGGQGRLIGAAATIYTQWMQVPAPEATQAQLAAALAELHTEAGWCCYDEGVDGMGHFTRALRLAAAAKDAYGVANAAWHAGVTLVRSGHPNDALKLFQLGQLHLRGFRIGRSTPTPPPTDPRLPTLTARLSRQSATAYAIMKGTHEATRCLTEAHEGWPTPRYLRTRGRRSWGRRHPARPRPAGCRRALRHQRGTHLQRKPLPPRPHHGPAPTRRSVRTGRRTPRTHTGPRRHHKSKNPAIRRRAPRTTSATSHRATNPTRQRRPRASPDRPTDRDPNLSRFLTG